eukprot:3269798-Amphidinium_carterae.1
MSPRLVFDERLPDRAAVELRECQRTSSTERMHAVLCDPCLFGHATTSYCYIHKGQCRARNIDLKSGGVDLHWAGTPCIDFSRMGKKKGMEGGNA